MPYLLALLFWTLLLLLMLLMLHAKCILSG